MTHQELDEQYDVVVVGGGPAGLSAAVALGRSRRSVLVVDAGEPRNAVAAHAHNYLGREGVAPTQLLADGRTEVTRYGGHVVTGRVVSAERGSARTRVPSPDADTDTDTDPDPDPDTDTDTDTDTLNDVAFRVGLEDGRTVAARRLLVSTGLVDELPGVPGLAQRWGRDVLHCPYCHGWEVRDRAIGILSTGALAVHQAQMFRQLSSSVTLFIHTGPLPSTEQLEELAARGITVVEGEVAALEVEADALSGLRLRSGEVVAVQALVVAPYLRARGDLLAGLGLELTEMSVGETAVAGHVAADPRGASAVPGVWVAGNVTNPQAQVVASAAAGLAAAAAINADLIAQDTRVAVTAHRAALGGLHRHEDAQPQGHQQGHDHHQHVDGEQANWFAQEFWDERYSGEPVWSGNPNPWLVHHAGDLTPGTALDVGSGEGADVVWLAARGWDVTGADISPVALARSARVAEMAGQQVAARTSWQQADMFTWEPPKAHFDLVSAQFMHLPGPVREALHRRLAAAVRPGGTLLVVGHHPDDHAGRDHPFPPDMFATAQEMARVLDPAEWIITTSAPARDPLDHEGTTLHLRDAVLVAVRRS